MQSNSVNGQPEIANITVVTDERQIIVPQAITSVVEVNNPGPQGPIGPQGETGPSGSTQPFINIGNDVYATTSSLQVTGSISGVSFVKTNGTSQQFLKADGSVDSGSYVSSSLTLTINGTTQDLSTDRTFNIPTGSTTSYRHDFNVFDYLGKAPGGSLDISNVWTITRLTIASSGSVTKGVATNVNWTDRYTHTYL